MGYRLSISKCKCIYYSTKLFGYVENEKLKSLQYLIDIGKLDKDVQFEYGIDNCIVLYKDNMKEFIKLYNEDLNNFDVCSDKKDRFINSKEIQDILNNEEEYYYVLEWC